MGGGESGVGAAVLAKVKGFDVFLSDKGTIEEKYQEDLRKWDVPFEQGGHTEELVLNADEVIKSPGIPGSAPMVRRLEAQGTPIISGEANACRLFGVAALSIDYYKIGYEAGLMAAKILTGEADIAELPIGYDDAPVKMYNPGLCAELGITPPADYQPIPE